MKIVLIHGQNHKGSSYNIGKLLVENITGEHEVSEYFLPRDLKHFCVGCCSCIEDDSRCPFYDEKKKIMDSIEAAELLIFTTPTYCMRASAPMKSFIDLTFTYWMPHRPRKCMFEKKAVVISTAAGMGTKTAIKDITDTLYYWGVPFVKSYGISVQAMNWEQVSEQKKQKIEKDIKKLAASVGNGKKPKVGIKTKMLFLMMRMMQRAGWGSSLTEKQYWEENGWLDKKRPWKTSDI